MAILNGINTKLRGSIGQYTFQRLNGQTVAKEKVEKKAIPVRTLTQMLRRVRWANLVNMYRAFEGTLHPSFESKDPRVSDYNMFMQANIGSSNVALSKNEAVQGACVVGPYQITRGQLPGILVGIDSSHMAVTDISVGGLSIGASTTLKAFSDAIIQNNDTWHDGDQISLYVATQEVDSTTGIPRVNMKAIEVTLDTSDEDTLLEDITGQNVYDVQDGMLKYKGVVIGGLACVHSRKVNGKTIVSTQRFVVDNPSLAPYTSQAAFDTAIESYGGVNKEQFLTPNVDNVYAPTNP
jgi:hypothetical protein